ncbi:helix-turn-helix domain-containing protein [Aureibaculum conchae]|uniref:helix-turn-helix domain-containing protein n=1 Tax=Aureibaculum sp. 2308TA14-22 TaxID=3108392 RepID=UPI00339333B5
MKINFSNFTESEFLWIKKMLIGSLLVIGFDFLLILFEVVFPEYKLLNKIDLTVVAMIIFIMYLGYYGVNQSKVLLPSFLLKEDGEPIDIIKEQKTASSINFTEEEIDLLEKNLRNVFKDEKPYLDEDLTLNKLAGQIGTTDKKLSAFLNQHLQTTFYNLINKERVESVKEKLNSDEFDNLTLLGIAYESGFKSKTSFNRIFKKETGLSPSEYKKTH